MIGMQYVQRVQFVVLQVATCTYSPTLHAYDTESLTNMPYAVASQSLGL